MKRLEYYLLNYWIPFVLVLIALCLLISAAGCNNPHARPLRGTPESKEADHYMKHVWMDPEEAQLRLDNRTKPADNLYDYMTR